MKNACLALEMNEEWWADESEEEKVSNGKHYSSLFHHPFEILFSFFIIPKKLLKRRVSAWSIFPAKRHKQFPSYFPQAAAAVVLNR